MTEKADLIYEVTLSVDCDVAGDIDGWLASHIEEMLLLPGFIGAEVFALQDTENRVRRVTHYFMENDAALENYLAGPAAGMRQSTVDRFSDQFDATRRVLHATDASSDHTESCLNCGTILAGQYCGQCGQRASSRLISVWELLRDAFGDLLELDSRVWQTLIPLAIRPGRLTRDYLRGRRARFMPPFRTYLVLSLLFFLVAFFDPQDALGILFEPDPATTSEQVEQQAQEELLNELADEGILVAPLSPEETDAESENQLVISFDSEKPEENCNFENFDQDDMPPWLARRLTKDRLQIMCDRVTAEGGKGLTGFLDKLLENVPAGLFVLLPLMALFLNILYPLSKRYYVEHLLFVVHYHAFIFLALISQILWVRLAGLLGLGETIVNIVVVTLSIYIGVYLYKALRRVYEQGHLVTALKFMLLFIAYSIGLALILLFAGIFAAFSI